MEANKKKALNKFLMTLAATTVSIVLTFGTTAIVDRHKKKAEKREMVMMIMFDMRETLENLGQCDENLNAFFDVQVEAVAHPQKFNESVLPLEIQIPIVDYTTTTESIFKSNIETIRTLGNILFVENVSSFYDTRARYKSDVVETFQKQAENALLSYENLRDFDSSGYPFLSQAYLGLMRKDFERCKMLMKVSDSDLEVFRTQHQKLLEATNGTASEDAFKASTESIQRRQKLQQAREQGMKEGL